MKYLLQFGLIAGISFVAEILYAMIPLPIPASIYGLLILFVLLMTKVVKLSQVEDAADFFMGIMPILFISPSVSLLTSLDIIKDNAVGLVLMIVLSTIGVTAVTGTVAQRMIRRRSKKEENE